MLRVFGATVVTASVVTEQIGPSYRIKRLSTFDIRGFVSGDRKRITVPETEPQTLTAAQSIQLTSCSGREKRDALVVDW